MSPFIMRQALSVAPDEMIAATIEDVVLAVGLDELLGVALVGVSAALVAALERKEKQPRKTSQSIVFTVAPIDVPETW